jgi:hypothetical protein
MYLHVSRLTDLISITTYNLFHLKLRTLLFDFPKFQWVTHQPISRAGFACEINQVKHLISRDKSRKTFHIVWTIYCFLFDLRQLQPDSPPPPHAPQSRWVRARSVHTSSKSHLFHCCMRNNRCISFRTARGTNIKPVRAACGPVLWTHSGHWKIKHSNNHLNA